MGKINIAIAEIKNQVETSYSTMKQFLWNELMVEYDTVIAEKFMELRNELKINGKLAESALLKTTTETVDVNNN